ncbi:DUF928 domain-containing protein [Phormidesmis sp. 146-35]
MLKWTSLCVLVGMSLIVAPQVASTQTTIFNTPPPPSGTPGGRAQGGGSRGDCQNYTGLTAIVPVVREAVWGLTATAHPTFWFYVPYELKTNTPIEFVLQDQVDNFVYRNRFQPSNTKAGLIQITIPKSAPGLVEGKLYAWTLSIQCDPSQPSNSVYVQGNIRRTAIAPALEKQLSVATPLEQVRLYSASGIWYDAFNQIAELHRTNPANPQVRETWTTLLRQTNLEPIATKPFTPCCTASY